MKTIKIPILTIMLTVLFGINSFAQTNTDFWLAFEQCTMLPEFQQQYPPIPTGAQRVHYIMDHGAPLPSLTGVNFTQNVKFLIEDKKTATSKRTEFFEIKDAKVGLQETYFEILYLYNFNSVNSTFTSTKVKLTKVKGLWKVNNSFVKGKPVKSRSIQGDSLKEFPAKENPAKEGNPSKENPEKRKKTKK